VAVDEFLITIIEVLMPDITIQGVIKQRI
jgi:hypothetical protein